MIRYDTFLVDSHLPLSMIDSNIKYIFIDIEWWKNKFESIMRPTKENDDVK